jgi:hypothetical protein
MRKEDLVLKIPNPHKGTIGVDLLTRILIQARISRGSGLKKRIPEKFGSKRFLFQLKYIFLSSVLPQFKENLKTCDFCRFKRSNLQGCLLIEVIFSVWVVVEAFFTHSISIKKIFFLHAVGLNLPESFCKKRGIKRLYSHARIDIAQPHVSNYTMFFPFLLHPEAPVWPAN